MIGGIGKMRPCGHHHYYKYAHATSGSHPNNSDGKTRDMYQVSREYWNDVDEDNCWNFSLENATQLNYYCFELGRFTKFKSKTPKLKNAFGMFTHDNGRQGPTLTEIEMDYENITNCEGLFYGSKLTDLPANFNPATRNFTHLLTGGADSIANAHGGVFPFYPVLNEATTTKQMFIRCKLYLDDNYTFEEVTNASDMFYATGWETCLQECPKNLSFKKLNNAANCFYLYSSNRAPSTFSWFQTKDTMENLTTATDMFYRQNCLADLYPDYESFSLPALSSAAGMFYQCILNAKSIKKLSDALPDWTGDTASHPITIGCHIDHKYDPEVNVALKKLQSSYITPIEELGFTLPEEITTDKNWTITVQWNGTATENAYPAPTV